MKNQLPDAKLLALLRGFYVFGDASVLKIVYELDRYGERNFSELRDELQINPSTLSKKLRMLTDVGLIASDRTHDNLRVYYAIVQHQKPLRRFLDSLEKLSQEI